MMFLGGSPWVSSIGYGGPHGVLLERNDTPELTPL